MGIVPELRAALRAARACLGAHAADLRVQGRTAQHKVCADAADIRAV
ncbi:MAG: hypothetical protein Q7J80_09330 [Anaerolineales bacterium]|nr:hypothetical protein [Anaerolineales bacterium]